MSSAPSSPTSRAAGPAVWLVAALLLSGIASVVYQPALRGTLVSDDEAVLNHPWMEELNLQNVLTILDPMGEPVLATANWAPTHLLAHVAQRELFGSYAAGTYPYHLTNVVLHGINATLFAAVLAAHGVPLAAALLAALVFLVHPANVEAVAWVFQLKTLLSFTFGFAALLCLARRPAVSTLFFALSILAKPSAGAVLAAAIVFEWLRQPAPGKTRRTRWLIVWAGLLALYGVVEIGAFQSAGGESQASLPLFQRALLIVAIVGRYLWITTTSLGVSAFHQPAPPGSLLDPFLLLGFVALLGMASVCVLALVRRHRAASWLGLAAASYAPVAQLFPFRYPMADRYLYFVIAGLLGALVVSFGPQLARGIAALRARRFADAPGAAAAALLALVLAGGYAAHAHARAQIWNSATSLYEDAVAHYPDGILGQLYRARRAVALGQYDEAADAIERSHELGSDEVLAYMTDPELAPLRGYPRYEELLQQMARGWLDVWENAPNKPPGFGAFEAVFYYILLGDLDRAEALLEEAENVPGAISPVSLQELRELIREQRG